MVNVSADRSNMLIAETAPSHGRSEQAVQLYEQFGKPLEPTRKGQYVAVRTDGRRIVGETLLDTIREATATMGPGSFVFKIGEGVVGTWR